jgi:hypothetical protein
MGRGCALRWTVTSWWPSPARTATPAMAFKQKYEAPFPMWPGAVRHKQPPFLTLWAPRQTAEVGWTPWSGCGLLWWVVSNRKFFWHQKWVLLCAAILCAPARSKIIEDYASMQTSYGCIFFKKSSVAAINITLGVPGRRADKNLDFWIFRYSVNHRKRTSSDDFFGGFAGSFRLAADHHRGRFSCLWPKGVSRPWGVGSCFFRQRRQFV